MLFSDLLEQLKEWFVWMLDVRVCVFQENPMDEDAQIVEKILNSRIAKRRLQVPFQKIS